MAELIIVGAGDHGRVVLDLARSAGHDVLGFVEPEQRAGQQAAVEREAVPVLGSLADAPTWVDRVRGAGFVVALGNNRARADAYGRCLALGLAPAPLVHPSAVVLGGAQIGAGAQVCAGTVIGVAARIGPNVIVNTAASVDHDNAIGEHVFIGPGARLAGRVTVDAGAHIGLGAVVREGTRIGDWAFVAAGAVVVDDVAPGARVAGVPARPMSASSAHVESK